MNVFVESRKKPYNESVSLVGIVLKTKRGPIKINAGHPTKVSTRIGSRIDPCTTGNCPRTDP